MKKCLIVLFAFLLSVDILFAQDLDNDPCNSKEHSEIDFWLGTWKVTWDGGEGVNTITKSHNRCIINENFDSPDLLGMSISMYDKKSGEWRQTWMDNQGSFLEFHGKNDGANYIFHTKASKTEPDFQLRMVFSDIEKDSLLWVWQSTKDGGLNWQELWKINYTKIK